MSTFNAVLKQYEENKQSTSGNIGKISQEDRLKKYFATLLPKGSKGEERKIRILPTKDGSSPFVEVYFHEIQVDGKWVKLYDPHQEGKPSPLNQVREGLLLSDNESDRILASSYRSRKFYIVKVIDRDNPDHGVKFWRFKHNNKGDGIFDKIYPIFKNKGDITDVETGRDLTISLTLAKANGNKEYTAVSSIIPEDKEPLHVDDKIAQEWVNDELTWEDVYGKKPFEYLEMVAKGEVPRWDNGKWVSNVTFDETLSSKEKTTLVDKQEDVVDEDLPF